VTTCSTSRLERQLEPQAARLLEQICCISDQYRSTIEESDPALGEALEHCAAALRGFLGQRSGAPERAAGS
jgi:hypothetical protein